MNNSDERVCIGRISKAHGTRGEVRISSYSDFPERFKSLKTVSVDGLRDVKELEVEAVRFHNRQVLIKFRGVDAIESADLLKGGLLMVDETDVFPLPEGYYYHFQLMGLIVTDEEHGELGPISEIIETGANDVYVVHSLRYGEILIPVIPQVVLNIDLKAKNVQVKLLPGLIDQEN